VAEFALVAVYGLLLVGTVLRQIPAVSGSRLLAWDSVGVFPGFSFFAPNPGNRDFHIVYRVTIDGQVGLWHDPLRLGARSALTAVWNPQKRVRKAIIDISGALAAEAHRRGRDDPLLIASIPYILLLHYVSSLVAESDATHVQFAVLATVNDPSGDPGKRSTTLLFSSGTHRIAR
jgi:hypothetical protein